MNFACAGCNSLWILLLQPLHAVNTKLYYQISDALFDFASNVTIPWSALSGYDGKSQNRPRPWTGKNDK